jgi:hypothetical protein
MLLYMEEILFVAAYILLYMKRRKGREEGEKPARAWCVGTRQCQKAAACKGRRNE